MAGERDAGHPRELGDESFRVRQRDRDRRPGERSLALHAGDRVADAPLGLVAEPLQRPESLLVDRAPQVVERLHAELGRKTAHRLRTHAG